MSDRLRLRDRVRAAYNGFRGRPIVPLPSLETVDEPLFDLPIRRQEAAIAIRHREGLTLSPVAGMLDSDDYQFRRISSGQKFKRRDLTPMQHDRMLEISWYLYEQNPFARRLITCMTDIVVGEGLGFEADDPKLLEAGQKVWNHPINQLGERARSLHDSLSLNGEMILPVGVNDVSGVPTIGFIDPYQVEDVESRVDNILVPEFVRLKKMPTETEGRRLKIIAADPVTGLLDGECFYFAINKLPNSLRGRSDFLPLGDWLDLFDQYMFAEVERVRLLSAFVYDLKIQNANAEQIAARVAEIGTPQSGSVFAHNENEELEAKAPGINATDRSETAKLLTIHIAGSLGMPISWFGWQDSNRATIEGQNDVAMKTPAARQKQFGGFLNQILRYGIEKQRSANAVLFKNLASEKYSITMPEIAAKDIARVSTALTAVVSANDVAMQNGTTSRRVATTLQIALAKHLVSGIDLKAQDVMDEADTDAEARQQKADEQMAAAAELIAQTGGNGTGGPGRGGPGGGRGGFGKKNPPPAPGPRRAKEAELVEIPDDVDTRLDELEEAIDTIRRRPTPQPITVNAPISVAPAAVTVTPSPVTVNVPIPPPATVTRETVVHRNPDKLIERTVSTDRVDQGGQS